MLELRGITMMIMRATGIVILMISAALPSFSQDRFSLILDKDWRFMKGNIKGAVEADYDDSSWREVRVPHDWAIAGPFESTGDGNTGKLPWKGQGWYRRDLDIPEACAGKTVYLIFDGVMSFPSVYINGVLVGSWDYGYNSFYLDITDHLTFGNVNKLAVHVDTRQHDSRWYPGAGIFRKVQLLAVDPVHIDIWGVGVHATDISDDAAKVFIETTMNNGTDQDQSIRVLQQIKNAQGNIVAEMESSLTGTGNGLKCIDSLNLSDPRRWDIDDPYLYELKTVLFVGGEQRDAKTTTFGVRDFFFTADDGFHLNGRRVQFKGVNLHHDLGPLGAAFNTRAMERQLEIMKEMGCNSVRNSHNVAAPELLELCDRMGLLVFDEIFDKYDGKADIVDTTDFNDFARRNIRNFVLRDRNHPSIFLWSVGNEIGDVQWNIEGGFQKLDTMVSLVREYDPNRPVTLVCDSRESAKLRHFDYYDVHSWNYGRRWSLARELEPGKAVIISESASTLSTRGFYELPLPEVKTDFTMSLQVSSYDLNAPWWAEVADDDFMWQQQEPYNAGEFVWTGFDYLGEPTPYNNQWAEENGMGPEVASRSSYFGIVDLCGIPKDRYYLYKSYWLPEEKTIHILPHWNWPDRIGKATPVFVYTNGDSAELFLNGKSQGVQRKQPDSENSIERFRLMWLDVVYEPGELKAVAYKDGRILGENFMHTAGEPYRLALTPDREIIRADGEDLSFVLVETFDKNGNPTPLAAQPLRISLKGSGEIAAVGNGNPQSFKSFQSQTVDLFYGKAMIILRSGDEVGTMKLKVKGPGLRPAAVKVMSVSPE